jgi:putative peptidoglycan lipid II flippase
MAKPIPLSRARLIKSVALMMTAALIGKALLVIREPIVAAYFGASAKTDAYNVAMVIVTMLIGITVSPISDILVPVYVERLHRDKKEGERFIRQTLTLYLLILSSVLLVTYFAAPWLVRIYAPGFASETSALAMHLTRILAFFAAVSGLAGYFTMVLTAHQEFLWVALGPIVTAAAVIVTLLAAASRLGIGALAWGMVAGNAVQMLLLGLSTRRWTTRPWLDFRVGEAVRALGRLSGWMLAGRFIGQGNDLIDRNMLSYLSEGSIAALGFARSIYLLPFEIFTTGITRVIIANFSWDVAKGDVESLKQDLSLAIRMAAFFMIPVTVALIVLRHPIVQLLYQRGAFDAVDVEATATVLMFLSLGLYFRALTFIVGRIFISMQSLVFPTVIAIGILAIHLVANLALIPALGLSGAAISLTIIEVVATIAYLAKTRQMFGLMGGKRIAISLTKMGIASGVMAYVIFLLGRFLGGFLSGGSGLQLITLAGMTFVGGLVYVASLYLSRSEELFLSIKLAKDTVSNWVAKEHVQC